MRGRATSKTKHKQQEAVVYDAGGLRYQLRRVTSVLGRNRRLLAGVIAGVVVILAVGWGVFAFIDSRRVLTYEERFDRDLQLAEDEAQKGGTPQERSQKLQNLGMAQYNKAQYKEAIVSFESALKLTPNSKKEIMPALAYSYASAQMLLEQQEVQLKQFREGKI